MEKYVSKQVRINKPESVIYTVLSDFNSFTPILKDHVEDWIVEGEKCSFKVKGMSAALKFINKEPYQEIKIGGDEGSPMEFIFWIQLKQVADYDTRMRLTLHVKLNMMMKMMLGKKLEKGIDTIAEKIAEAFNSVPL